MEKKILRRQLSAPQTATNADSKKDNVVSGRGGRYRREWNGRVDVQPAACRPTNPRTRTAMDKRPRARGYCNELQRQDVMQEDGAEHGSALLYGSKKGNLNHLLNFTFAPHGRERGYGGRAGGSRPGGGGRGKPFMRRVSKYNKEQFVQANCQFVVRDHADYSTYAADPDLLVDWQLIEQVRVISHSPPNCPICLYPPTAAKMTRCGHIYCWSCILHYLSLSDKTWRKCPICYESVYQDDLKSVTTLEVHRHDPGEQITMKLMKRSRGSIVAFPKAQCTVCPASVNIADGVVDTCYSKLLTVSKQQVLDMIETEEKALQWQLTEQGPHSLEATFTQAAIDLLEKRRTTLLGDVEDVSCCLEKFSISPKMTEVSSEMCAHHQPSLNVINYECAFLDEQKPMPLPREGEEDKEKESVLSDGDTMSSCADVQDVLDSEVGEEEEEDEQSVSSEVTDEVLKGEDVIQPDDTGSEVAAEKKVDNEYYFYQAADGQHIYLHSLNARCLSAQYGSLQNSPETITAVILQMDAISMTEELRRRLRYMNHLPLTCEFQVVELEMKPPLVSEQTLQAFAGQIEGRRRLRQRKCKDEKRHSRRIQEEENRKMGKYPSMRMCLTSKQHFPQYSVDAEDGQSSAQSASDTSNTASVNSASSSLATSPIGSDNPIASSSWKKTENDGNVSFAQMLRGGVARSAGPGWPTSTVRDIESDSEDRPPTYQHSFGDALQKALDTYDKSAEKKRSDADDEGTGRKKGKKRTPKKLLFATTMARHK